MSWWQSLFPKRASDEQMNSELRFHIDELTEEHIAAGMSPEEAHRRARLDFGGDENLKEQVRDVYRIRLLDATLANLKSALRFISKSPTFSLTIILTLALAIGANSAVFSAIDAILLKPLPFPQADQLVRVDSIRSEKCEAVPPGCSSPPRGLESSQFHVSSAYWVLHRGCLRIYRPFAGESDSCLGLSALFSSLGSGASIGPRIYARGGGPQRPKCCPY